MSLASGTSTESIDIILSQQHPPICIQVQTEVELVPLTWDEVSTTLSPDARSKCWAGQWKDEGSNCSVGGTNKTPDSDSAW